MGVTPRTREFGGSGYAGRDFSWHKPELSPDQAPLDTSRGIPPLLKATKRRVPRTQDATRIALLPQGKVRHGNNRLQATRWRMIRQSMPLGRSAGGVFAKRGPVTGSARPRARLRPGRERLRQSA